jgi:hypothetical protein
MVNPISLPRQQKYRVIVQVHKKKNSHSPNNNIFLITPAKNPNKNFHGEGKP